MKKYYLLLIFLLFNTTTFSQTISGKIIDQETKESLIGVNIILENGNGTSTDINGSYNLKTNKGEQKVIFKYIGYKDIEKIIFINNNENKTINISLKKSSKQLSTVVVSAGRFEQKIEEITVSMEVIKPSLIENKNTTDIQTAIDQVPGVNITDGQANIRGGSGWSYGAGSRVLVMVDDMPLISGDAGQVQWKLIATENINQIEIIKGASSVLYGSSALNGVMNIRTAFPSQNDIDKKHLVKRYKNTGYTKVNMHFGLIDKARRESLNWSGDKRRAFKGIEFLQAFKANNLDFTFGGNIFKDDGYRQGEITDRKRFNINSRYTSTKIKGLSYGLNANFLFQSSGSAMIWESLENAYIPLNNEITTTNGDTYNIDPFFSYINGNNKHSLKTRYLKVINDNSTKGLDNNQDNESEIYYSDYQWQKNLEKYNTRITSGFTNELVYARAELFQGNNYRRNHSLYTQIDKKWNKLNLSFGTRYEYFSIKSEKDHIVNEDTINHIHAGKPVFRTGLNYEIAESTYLRASWGQGYRFPSMAELFITANQAGIEIYPNANLKPESGWSSEIGVKQGVKINNWMGYADIAAFLMQYDDMMEFTFGAWGDPSTAPLGGLGFKSVNVGKTQISGIEISLTGQGKINKNLIINMLAGYTYINPISLELNTPYATSFGGQEEVTYAISSSDTTILKYRYKHIAKIDAEIKYKNLSFGSSLRYNDFMKNIDKVFTTVLINGNYADNPLRNDVSLGGSENEEDLNSYEGVIPGINAAREKFKNGDLIFDARIAYNLNTLIRIGLVVNNVFNTEYMSRPATMMPPRTFALQCNLKI